MNNNSLTQQLMNLYKSQIDSWEELKTNVNNLSFIKKKEFLINDALIKVQFNPCRVTSTLAKIDPESIAKRKCFLCKENLPKKQVGFTWNNEYLVLCNPKPIFPYHFTVSHIDHIPQDINNRESDFINLVQELKGKFTLLFNGAKAGASAPDHFHFQICPTNELPVFSRIKKIYPQNSFFQLSIAKKNFNVVLSNNIEEAITKLKQLAYLDIKAKEIDSGLVNILGTMIDEKICLVIAQREKHRPSCYTNNDEEKQILVSPASVEMAGVFITAKESDFNKLNSEIIINIYNEVLAS